MKMKSVAIIGFFTTVFGSAFATTITCPQPGQSSPYFFGDTSNTQFLGAFIPNDGTGQAVCDYILTNGNGEVAIDLINGAASTSGGNWTINPGNLYTCMSNDPTQCVMTIN